MIGLLDASGFHVPVLCSHCGRHRTRWFRCRCGLPGLVCAGGSAPAHAVTAEPLARCQRVLAVPRSEEHTSELQSLMRNSYAVFCLQKTIRTNHDYIINLSLV